MPPKLLALLRTLPKKTTPMEVLRTGVSALSSWDPDADDNSREATLRKCVRLTAQMPTLVAAWERMRRGKAPIAPNPKLSLAANFLYMMSGKKPTDLAVKTFDIALILHADHEFNASTFAARVTAATLSDLHSAITSAIGALKGPLHGGANEQVMLMVEQIKDPAKAEAWIRKALADKARIMGFGHRVYRVEDPRAKHLRRLATELGQQIGNTAYVQILNTMAKVVTADKHIYPERRPVLGRGLQGDGHLDRSVHADLRDEPGGGVGGARARAARQQPADPPAGGVHGADARQLRADLPALSGSAGAVDRIRQGPRPRQRLHRPEPGRSAVRSLRSLHRPHL